MSKLTSKVPLAAAEAAALLDERREPASKATGPSIKQSHNFRKWLWTLVPLLAIAAYLPVLRIGFLADDLILLNEGQITGVNFGSFVPGPADVLYRPVGTILTWQLGWQLWGFNALPYHIIGLLLHASIALVLALFIAEITSSRPLGWLAGALFAVFPLHLEAVGWLAAQWDLWAAFFGLVSLWLFTMCLKNVEAHRANAWKQYVLSVLFFALGVFSKESLVAFLPIFPLTSWLVQPTLTRARWRSLGLALLPYFAVLVLNVVIRLIAWGRVGGYATASTDYWSFGWDAFISFGRMFLSPVNTLELGTATAQIVGLVTSFALLVAVVSFGSAQRRLLFASFAWIICALIPVLNLFSTATDLPNNRLVYLASAGYCFGVAVLIRAVFTSVRNTRLRLILSGFVILALLSSAAVCWLQLRPWRTATVQAIAIDEELQRLIPPRVRPQGMVWLVQDLPLSYKGALLYINGLGNMRHFTTGDTPAITDIRNATSADLLTDSRDTFAMKFGFYPQDESFHIVYLAGLTSGDPPPIAEDKRLGQTVWDFTKCDSNVLQQWQPVSARAMCLAGTGLVLDPSNSDPQLIGPENALQPPTGKSHFLRVRVSMVYPLKSESSAAVLEWFWQVAGKDWNPADSRKMAIKNDGKPHTYWMFLDDSGAGAEISRLRFDPTSVQEQIQIRWIAIDLVE